MSQTDAYDAARFSGYSIESAEQDVAAMADEIADYLCGNCTVEREPSEYFGPISNAELLQVAFKLESKPEQIVAAMRILRRRYLDDRAIVVDQLVEDRR